MGDYVASDGLFRIFDKLEVKQYMQNLYHRSSSWIGCYLVNN